MIRRVPWKYEGPHGRTRRPDIDLPEGVHPRIRRDLGDEVEIELDDSDPRVRAMLYLKKSTIIERLTEPGELKAVRDKLRQLRDSDDEGELYLVMLWDAGRSFRRAHHAFESLKSMLLQVLVQVHGDEDTAEARVAEILAPE